MKPSSLFSLLSSLFSRLTSSRWEITWVFVPLFFRGVCCFRCTPSFGFFFFHLFPLLLVDFAIDSFLWFLSVQPKAKKTQQVPLKTHQVPLPNETSSSPKLLNSSTLTGGGFPWLFSSPLVSSTYSFFTPAQPPSSSLLERECLLQPQVPSGSSFSERRSNSSNGTPGSDSLRLRSSAVNKSLWSDLYCVFLKIKNRWFARVWNLS